MKNLQVAGRSNVIYLLAKAVGTRRADDADTLLPVRRMPMGLIEYTTSLPLVYSTVHSGVECGTIFSASEVLQPLLNVQNRQPVPQDVFLPRTTPFLHSSKHFYSQPFCQTNSYLNSFVPKLEFTASICQILRLYLLLQIFSERPDECISLCQPHVLIHYLLALAICV